MRSLLDSKLASFAITDEVYAAVSGEDLKTSILVPKQIHEEESRSRPLIVFWHGGGFILGDKLYEPWWPRWLLEMALVQNAVIISPNHRLAPEANATEIMDDVTSFWSWLYGTLPDLPSSQKFDPDVSRIVCAGQSSGGLLAVQSALLFPNPGIQAVISISAPLHFSIPELTIPHQRPIMGVAAAPPRDADALIRKYLKTLRPGDIRTSGDPTLLWPLLTSILHRAWMPRLLKWSSDDRMNPMATLHRAQAFPPMWLIHAEQDSVVPSICSVDFAESLRRTCPSASVELTLIPGEHNFDVELTMRQPWIREGCDFICKHWL